MNRESAEAAGWVFRQRYVASKRRGQGELFESALSLPDLLKQIALREQALSKERPQKSSPERRKASLNGN